MIKEKITDKYYTYVCEKCKKSMQPWARDPVTKEQIYLCSTCGKTEREKI